MFPTGIPVFYYYFFFYVLIYIIFTSELINEIVTNWYEDYLSHIRTFCLQCWLMFLRQRLALKGDAFVVLLKSCQAFYCFTYGYEGESISNQPNLFRVAIHLFFFDVIAL